MGTANTPSGAFHAVSLSGGKDSTALLGRSVSRLLPPPKASRLRQALVKTALRRKKRKKIKHKEERFQE